MGKRGRRGAESDDDYEESPSQRQRVDDDDDDDVQYEEEPESQFVKGAIVKVVLRNFMTYGRPVEIRPGPRLNLVLGPNGTGKSSFVCAMCIGLGFPTKLLGRAKEIREYVKTGEQAAEITISLSQGPGERPLTVFRTIFNTGESKFRLNGKSATIKEVAKKMQEMNVQMDNLCQFLPQDRVVAFAQLSPVELLEETEKAVDEEGLYKEHVWLKEAKAGIKGREQQLERDKAELARLEEVQAGSERDVRRVQERNKLEEEKALLERSLPWLEAEEVRLRFEAAKEEEKQAVDEVNRRKKEADSASAPLTALEAERVKIEKKKEANKVDQNRLDTLTARHKEEYEKADGEMTSARNEIARLERLEEQRKRQLKKNEADLAKCQSELAGLERPEETLDPEQLEELERRLKENELTLRQIKRQEAELAAQQRHAQGQLADANRQLQAISSVREKRLATLLNAIRSRRGPARVADHIEAAAKFVEANRGQFKGEVFGPVCCEIATGDEQNAAYLEQAVGKRFLEQFIVLNKHDYEVLQRNTQASITLYTGDPDAPVPEDLGAGLLRDLARSGVTSRLDQTFEAPPVVKRALCEFSGIHRMVVGGQNTAQRVKEVIDAAEAAKVRLTTVWTPHAAFASSRSRYGEKALSTSVNQIQQARYLARTTDDSGRLAEANRKKEEAEGLIRDAEVELRMYDKQRREAEATVTELNREREKATKAQLFYERRKKELVVKERELTRAVEEGRKPSSNVDAIGKTQRRLAALASRLAAAALQGAAAAADAIAASVEMGPLLLALKEVKARKEALTKDIQKSLASVEEAKRDLTKARDKCAAIKAQFKDLKAKAEKAGAVSPEDNERVMELVRQSRRGGAGTSAAPAAGGDDDDEVDADALRAAIEEKTAAISQMFCADPSVVQQYQERAKKIEELRKAVHEMSADVNEVHAGIKARSDVWLPKLRAVVASIADKFANSFRIIGSVGTVNLHEPEDGDFGKYEARIMVRFRDGENLSQLTANRQSGGERSVSTMFYLICLQDMTRCPFRMVDEINQGMDKKNERLVFQEMVRTSSAPNTPQCFLITPKLLPQLDYGKFTTVHCIFNGPHVADVARQWAPERLFGPGPGTPQQRAAA